MAMEEGADVEVRIYNSPGSLSGKSVPDGLLVVASNDEQ